MTRPHGATVLLIVALILDTVSVCFILTDRYVLAAITTAATTVIAAFLTVLTYRHLTRRQGKQ